MGRTFNGSHNSRGGQVHWFGGLGDDTFNIGLNNYNGSSYRHDSHHVYGWGGDDTYNFVDFDSLGDRTTGRLDTFDPTRDTIEIEGTPINLGQLPATVNGINLSVVEFNGQQWLRMKDGNRASALFALEGARRAENTIEDVPAANRNVGGEETHFYNLSKSFINSLATVAYENPLNFVPVSYYQSRLSTLDEIRVNSANFTATNASELIYDNKFGSGDRSSHTIDARGGNDVVNALTGNDVVFGGSGHDDISGGADDDILHGGSGNDALFGGTDADVLYGGSGRDELNGARDNDVLDGGSGGDTMTGGEGEDMFTIGSGDLVRWGQTSGSWTARNKQLDVITDFTFDEDVIRFEASSGVDDLSDLRAWKTTLNGDLHYTIQVRATGERILVDVANGTSWSDLMDADNFIFGNNTTWITDADMFAWGALSGNGSQRNAQLTVVDNFRVGVDTIRFSDSTDIDELADLRMWKTTINGNVHFTIREKATNERILVDVADNVSWGQIYDEDNFIFG